MKNAFASLSFLLLTSLAGAQTAFSVSTNTVTVVKPADFFVAYFYADIYNNTGADLAMRWVKLPPGSHDPAPPSEWEFTFQDPENFYDPAIDSADFTLPATPQSTDKLILQAYPNLTPGHGIFRYKIFPIDDPDDSAVVTYDYTFTKVVTAAAETAASHGISLFPNPSEGVVFLKNESPESWEVAASDVSGRLLETFQLAPQSTKKLPAYPPGTYFLTGINGGKKWSEKWYVN